MLDELINSYAQGKDAFIASLSKYVNTASPANKDELDIVTSLILSRMDENTPKERIKAVLLPMVQREISKPDAPTTVIQQWYEWYFGEPFYLNNDPEGGDAEKRRNAIEALMSGMSMRNNTGNDFRIVR